VGQLTRLDLGGRVRQRGKVAVTKDQAQKIVDKAAEDLGEFFCAVKILVTGDNGDVSEMSQSGSGNWFTQHGMIHHYLERDSRTRMASEISRYLPEP